MSKKAQKFIKAAASAAVKLIRENDSDTSSSGDDANSDSSIESTNDNLTTDPSFVCDVNLSDNITDRATRAALRGQTRPEVEVSSSEEEGGYTQIPVTVTQSPVSTVSCDIHNKYRGYTTTPYHKYSYQYGNT